MVATPTKYAVIDLKTAKALGFDLPDDAVPEYASGDAPARNPITGIVCRCARAASGQVAAAPPSSERTARRLSIRSPERADRYPLGNDRRRAGSQTCA
jgi:hypothetical protein